MDLQKIKFGYSPEKYQDAAVPKTFVSNVFSWMFLALGITAFVAYYFAANESFMKLLIYADPQTGKGGMTGLGWIVMLAPLGLVLLMSLGMNKLSAMAMTLIFIVYSVLMGMSLSFIFLIYTSSSIAITFVVSSAMFGVMAVAGYTTKADLTKFGSIMFMGLIGIIIASVINMFMRSSGFDYIISFIGVLIFTGLTAYDVQKLKNIGSQIEAGTDTARKMAIFGALTLYLDFINLFLFLLRFLGRRN
ncbi:MAG: Bax inhibitor-1/YccA family protein [Bacteroidales bacterium]|nr:Bax inhibitor-1/YccA family protein [Bacteroidales bacterium]